MTTASAAVTSTSAKTDEDECLLMSCGHSCAVCGPVLRLLLLLCQRCIAETPPQTDIIVLIRSLLTCFDTMDEAALETFRTLISETQVEWVREFAGFMAAAYGGTPYLKALQALGVDLAARQLLLSIGGEWDCLLNYACLGGRVDSVNYLLESVRSHGPGFRRESGDTPLHFAAHNGRLDCIQALLDWSNRVSSEGSDSNDETVELSQARVDIDVANFDGMTPLHAAAHNGQVAAVRLLLQRGAKVDARDKWGDTSLMKAAVNGHEPVAAALLEHGAEIDALNLGFDTPFRKAIYHGHSSLARLLVQKGADLSLTSEKNISPLHLACFKGHLGCVSLLLEHDADVNFKDESQMTPLFFAAVNGHVECMQLLIEHGSQVNSVDDGGKSPLHTAARRGFAEAVRLLLTHGAVVDPRDTNHWTPLFEAICEGHDACVVLLLHAGAQVNICDAERSTPLHLAARLGQIDFVRLLLALEADVNAQDYSMWTPLHEASLPEVAAELLDWRADIDAQDCEGYTPLHSAVEHNDFAVAELLIARGASLDIRNKYGLTPYDLTRPGTTTSDSIRGAVGEIGSPMQPGSATVLSTTHDGGGSGGSGSGGDAEVEGDEEAPEEEEEWAFEMRERLALHMQEELKTAEKRRREARQRKDRERRNRKRQQKALQRKEAAASATSSPAQAAPEAAAVSPTSNTIGLIADITTSQATKKGTVSLSSVLASLSDSEDGPAVEPVEHVAAVPATAAQAKQFLILQMQLEAAQQAMLDMEQELEQHRQINAKLRGEMEVRLLEQLQPAVPSQQQSATERDQLLASKCRICKVAPRTAVILPCVHQLFCRSCVQSHQRCPAKGCQMPIAGILEVRSTEDEEEVS